MSAYDVFVIGPYSLNGISRKTNERRDVMNNFINVGKENSNSIDLTTKTLALDRRCC